MDIRLFQFPSKPSPIPTDIVYLGNVSNSYEESQVTIEALISAYPNLIDLANNPPISALALTLLSNTTTTQMQSTLGLVIGTDIQPYSAALASIAGLTTVANNLIYTTASDTYAVISPVNNAVLRTNGSGVPSFSTTLPSGLSATNITLVTPLSLGIQGEDLNMGGFAIINLLDPVNPQDAATKAYTDSIAGGFTVILSCYSSTTADLNATQAGAGVGATLTNAGAMAAFNRDGVSPPLNSRILVKDQILTEHNGVYVLTTVGSGAVNWVLTRATDYDSNTEIVPGTLIAVNNGTVNANTSWLETATVAVVDTDPVVFSQFTFAPGAFLLKAQNLFDLTNVVTARSNLGLGSVATKTASDVSKTFAVMLDAASTIGNMAVFTDVNGTVGDGGTPLVSTNNFVTGRLTLSSGLPVPTTDVLAAVNIYFTPMGGNYISLFDGASTWNIFPFTELSIAVPGTTNTVYDVFVYDNTGTPTLELTAWTNLTTRATALVYQNGVLVKTGATTRRYLGTFSTTSVSGQTEDSVFNRYMWNYYNRVTRPLYAVDTANSWTYSVNAYRQSNANAANQVNFVIGVAEDAVKAFAASTITNSTTSFRAVRVGIGVDSTTVNSATLYQFANVSLLNSSSNVECGYENILPAGRHFLAWLERGAGADVQTWYGDNGGFGQNGITGEIRG